MTVRFRSTARLVLLALLPLAAGCGDDPTGGPEPGAVVATLVSPDGQDGGVLIEVTGVGVTAVQAVEGEALLNQDEGVARIAAVRGDAGEIRLVVSVEDVGTTPSGRVLQVVDARNRQRPLAGYSVRWER